MAVAADGTGQGGEFRFTKALKPESGTPRWLRSGPFLLLMTCLVIGSMVFGERLKDWYQTNRLTGVWIGEEEEPGGLWVREIEHRFYPDGRLRSIQRFLPEGALRAEESESQLTWRIRNSFLILESPLTGPMPARIRKLGREELLLGEQAKIRVFRKVGDEP